MSHIEAECAGATNGIIWALRTEARRAVQKKLANKYESKFQMIKETEKGTENLCQEQKLRYKFFFKKKGKF